MTWRSTIATGVIALLAATHAWAQAPTALFNGKNLAGWRRFKTEASVKDGTLRVGAGKGWLRHDRVFDDFVLVFDMRLVGSEARAGVYLRAWNVMTPTGRSPEAFQAQFYAGAAAAASGAGRSQQVATTPASAQPTVQRVLGTASLGDRWHQVRITCRGDRATIELDGSVLVSETSLTNPQGFIGFWADAGTMELRSVAVTQLPLTPSAPPPGVFALADVTERPTVVLQVKPEFTSEAAKAGIVGTVFLEAIVLSDGTVGDVTIRRSLDPEFGLDQAAIVAAKQWRFRPATVNGNPVPVLTSISLTFAPRK